MTEAVRRDEVPWLFLVAVLAFWPTLVTLPAHWLSFNEHGFVVAALVVWLMWRDRNRIVTRAGPAERDLLPVLLIASILWLLARVIDVGMIHHTLFYLIVFGWVATVFGRPVFGIAAPIAVTALIAAPLWDVFVPVLQRLAVIVTGAITTLGGVDAEIGAYTIGISTGTFIVEAGCSGLNYLLVSLTLGAMYAHLFIGEARVRLQVIAIAAGIALLSNWIRISALVFVGEATAMQSSLIDDHVVFGWFVFTVMLLPTYILIRWAERRADARGVRGGELESPVDPEHEVPPARFDAGRLRTARAATLATAAGPLLYMAVGLLPRPGVDDRSTEVLDLRPDAAIAASAPEWTPDFAGIDDREDWTIRVEESVLEVQGSRFWFLDQRMGEELIQGANRIAADSVSVSSQYVSADGGPSRIVRESIFFEDDEPRLTWSWFRVAGQETPFPRNAKLLEIWAWLTRAGPSELLLLSAPCEPDSCESAAGALRAVVADPSTF